MASLILEVPSPITNYKNLLCQLIDKCAPHPMMGFTKRPKNAHKANSNLE